MLKNILKLNGVLELNKVEQKSVNGGNSKAIACTSDAQCEATGDFCPGQVRCIFPFGVCLGRPISFC